MPGKALKQRKADASFRPRLPVCVRLYAGKLLEAGLQASMTEELHCYENAVAERVNGILKQEYYISSCFRNKNQAEAAVKQAVYLYNTRRYNKRSQKS
jgi:transposase InsO family protein